MFTMTTSHGDDLAVVEIRPNVWEAALPEGGYVEFYGTINDAVEGCKGLACMNGGYEWEEEDVEDEERYATEEGLTDHE